MSTSYQTSAKPRGRRETGRSNSPSRHRAPSETSSGLTKKVSRSSDEGALPRGNRPSSPASYAQRNRTTERPSLLESILPKSSSASTRAARADSNNTPLVIQPSKRPSSSTPSSPFLTSHPEPSLIRSSVHTSKPLMSAVVSDLPTDGEPSSTQQMAGGLAREAKKAASLDSLTVPASKAQEHMPNFQPTVIDLNEELTPTPTPIKSPTEMFPEFSQRADVQAVSPSPILASGGPVYGDSNMPMAVDHNLQTWAPTASPSHSPITHQYAAYPSPMPTQYPYAYAPHMMAGGLQMYSSPYYSAPFSPTEYSVPPESSDRISRSGSEDDHGRLLEKISSILPDINKLLDHYRENPGRSVDEDTQSRHMQVEYEEQLRKLQIELDANKREYEKVIQNLVNENNQLRQDSNRIQSRSHSSDERAGSSRKLKSDFEALQAQHQDLAQNIDSIRLSKEQLVAEKLGHEKYIESMKRQHHADKDLHHKTISGLKAEHSNELASREKEHQKITTEHKAALGKVQLELASLITKHTAQKKELETSRGSEAEHRMRVESMSKDLGTANASHAQELARIKEEHRQSLELVKKELETNHMTREKEWKANMDQLHAAGEKHKNELEAEREAHATLKQAHDERHRVTGDLAALMSTWKLKHDELQKENEKIDRMLQQLGHRTDTCSKSEPP